MNAAFPPPLSRIGLFFVMAILVGAGGCGFGNSGKEGAEAADGDLSAPSLESILQRLEGRAFRLVDWESVAEFDTYADLMGRPVSIEFLEAGKFGAQGPVNRLMGTMLVAEDGYLAVDKRIASTMMAGPEPLMDLERRLIEELGAISELVLENNHLALVHPDGGVLHFEETSADENL